MVKECWGKEKLALTLYDVQLDTSRRQIDRLTSVIAGVLLLDVIQRQRAYEDFVIVDRRRRGSGLVVLRVRHDLRRLLWHGNHAHLLLWVVVPVDVARNLQTPAYFASQGDGAPALHVHALAAYDLHQRDCKYRILKKKVDDSNDVRWTFWSFESRKGSENSLQFCKKINDWHLKLVKKFFTFLWNCVKFTNKLILRNENISFYPKLEYLL